MADPVAEEKLIAEIMLEPKLMEMVAPFLKITHLSVNAHGVIYRAIVVLYNQGKPINPVSLANELIRQRQLPGEPAPEKPDVWQSTWRKEGCIYTTRSGIKVRSKSEVLIANALTSHNVSFCYEAPLWSAGGTRYLPDFTIIARNRQWFWEHVGMLSDPEYRSKWENKRRWYARFFPDQMICTVACDDLRDVVYGIIHRNFL